MLGIAAALLVVGGAASPLAFAVSRGSERSATKVHASAVTSAGHLRAARKHQKSHNIAHLDTTVTLRGTLVGIAPSPRTGYWEVASAGGIFNAGQAPFAGSMGGHTLYKPVVGMTPDPSTGGYWEVASDGGIFAFNAPYLGSMGGHTLYRPVVGIAATPDGNGYWEVASDGGIFAFGDAPFYGSMGGHALLRPVVGIASTPDGRGYWEVASDGGVFTFGDARFYGSMGGHALAAPVSGIASTPSGNGYWEVARDGGIFTFGDAQFLGRATRAPTAPPPNPPSPPAPSNTPPPTATPPAGTGDPPSNIAPVPAYTFEKGGTYTSSLPCWQLGATSWIPEPSSPQCLTAEIQATDAARADQGLGPMQLPSNWGSLTAQEQLFVITDIERVSRGEAPIVGLSSLLDSYAQNGAASASDPQFNFSAIASSDWWGSNYASGVLNALDANYTWMYEDGYGGYNIDCSSPGAPGCWGHRHNILTSTYGGTLVMGAGVVPGSTGSRMSELFVSVQNAADLPGLYYTWAEAVGAGAGG